MRILFVCPTNPRFMPYLNNFLEVVGTDHEVELIIWDRFNDEKPDAGYIYRRGGARHQRGLLDYYMYGRFIRRHLKSHSYDRIICFGLQMAFFLRRELRETYSGRYIVDIRDYNKIARFYDFEGLIKNSALTVISSAGYKSWLPNFDRYFINHNTLIKSLADVRPIGNKRALPVSISSIGALRDLKINTDFIASVAGCSEIQLSFHGQGDINSQLSAFVNDGYSGVAITGYYPKEREPGLYMSADMINVFRYPDSLNNNTALPNRLYSAPIFAKPLLAFKGTYLADLIEVHELGLVVSSFHDVGCQILEYFERFDPEAFDISRRAFLSGVIHENDLFNRELLLFLERPQELSCA